MKRRTLTGSTLAIALIAPAPGVVTAEPSSPGSPNAGPDQAVMSTASHTEIIDSGVSGYVANDRMLSVQHARAALEPTPASEQGSAVEILVAPVVIESDVPNPDPTLDQLMQRFRTALGQPAASNINERRLGNGAIEVTTSFGRFCTTPPPGYIQSGLGGDITLAGPCTLF